MLPEIRTEIGSIATGIPQGFNRYEEMVIGMLQLGVDSFAGHQGVPLSTNRYCTRAVRYYTLFEDRDEIVHNLMAAIHTKVIALLPSTIIKHRFAYRLLPSCNLLIALDPREFEHEPVCNDPIELNSDSL